MREPTYSQIHMAILAMYPALKPEQITQTDRDNMKRALMAAQKVDRNVYGDMHYGWATDGVHFMCNSAEAQRKLSKWHHAATSTLPYHAKHTIPELKQLRTHSTDLSYMLAAVVQMLGPKARKVWKMWKDRGVVRPHTSWNPEFLARASGEEVAQAHLDMFETEKTAVPVENIDGIDVVS